MALRQGGIIGRPQLLEAEVSRNGVDLLVSSGTLVRIVPGVSRLSETEVTWRTTLWEHVLRAGPLSFAYRRSAAALWQLDGFDLPDSASPPEVGVARGRRSRRPGVHRLSGLRAGDITRLDGMRVSTPMRTLLDLGTTCSPDLVERAVECALRRGLADESIMRRDHAMHTDGARLSCAGSWAVGP